MAALLGTGAVTLWHGSSPVPELAEICALARHHQFDQAESLAICYLRNFPGSNRAHLLMAQFALDRPDPAPQRALEHLDQIQPRTSQEAAVVRFSKGKAFYMQKGYHLAESCWKEALQLDPMVPEAGWALIDLLDFEGRVVEAHELGMHLFESETDRRDQARLLLEMTRLDIDKIAPGSQVQVFEPALRRNPENLALGVAVGLALVHDSRSDQGFQVLRNVLRQHPESATAWDGLLTGLADGFQPEQLAHDFGQLPQALITNPRFAKHEGAVAQSAREWAKAIMAYRRARAFEPHNGVVLYHLWIVLRAAGEADEFRQIDELLTNYQAALEQMREAYNEAFRDKSLGITLHLELYHRLGTLREQLGRFDEACAWHRLVLRDVPDDAHSLAALKRLEYHTNSGRAQEHAANSYSPRLICHDHRPSSRHPCNLPY
jgi:tetratricopeptide (TPR) repeat protein